MNMNKFKVVAVFLLASATMYTGIAQAGHVGEPKLIDRGNGMIYDTVQDITWLSNANVNGAMSYDNAVTWADTLVFGGYDDWRLFDTCDSNLPSCTGDSELGHLYFNLFDIPAGGNIADASGHYFELFSNIQNGQYWSGNGSFIIPIFDTNLGTTSSVIKSSGDRFAWAVRDGDVALVSAPSATLFAVPLLLGLVTLRRRKLFN